MNSIKHILLFTSSFVIILLILELFISSTHIVEKSYNEVYKDIGRARRPGFEYIMFNEGFSIGRFNKYRYLGPGYAPKKPENTLRIALMGDSYVEGFQVFDRHHFRSILENNLDEKLEKNVQVLNFGRSSFDLADMYAYSEKFVKNFNPDIILYFISKGDLAPRVTDPLSLKVKQKNDSIYITKDFPQDYMEFYHVTKWLIQHSSVMNLLNNCRKTAASTGTLPIMFGKFYSKNNGKAGHNKNSQQEFQIPEISMKILKNISPDTCIFVNRQDKNLNKTFVDSLKRQGFTYIDLSNRLIKLKQNDQNPFYWKATKTRGHWNHETHRAVGNYLSEKLLKQTN